jgi:hypothetical protein
MYTNQNLNGVQGWLLLFIIQRLYAPFALLPTFANMHATVPFTTDRAHEIFLINLISSTLSALIGVLATIGIFRRTPWALNAVAMNLLLVIASYGIGFLQHGSFNSAYLSRAIPGMLVSIAWFSYFMVSERVRNTLGHNLLKAPIPSPEPISLP